MPLWPVTTSSSSSAGEDLAASEAAGAFSLSLESGTVANTRAASESATAASESATAAAESAAAAGSRAERDLGGAEDGPAPSALGLTCVPNSF